jgi:multicomponent Na+:H+ antiporter subunit D
MCISSYVLVAFRKGQWEPVEAGFKYLVMSATGSALIIFAIALLYGMTGSVILATISTSIAGVQAASQAKLWIYLTLAVVIIGFGIKASIVPLHTWLPDAHPAAPSPISAMLSGVVIQTGVYAIIRFLYLIFQPAPISWPVILASLSIVAVLTMTTGNVMALLQNDIKRLLAFSSIAHVGYILLAVSVGTVLGLSAGLLHIMNHAIMKGLLFLCAGVFVHAVGTRNIESLAGIGHKMNVTAVILTIGALAISGIPPLNGFISEFLIVLATLDANMLALTIILLINILIGFAYYLRLLYVLVWKAPGKNLDSVKEAPLSMLVPMMLLTILCVAIGVWPGPFIDFANQAAQATINILTYVAAI